MADVSEQKPGMPQDVSQAAPDDVFVFPASFAQQRLWFLDKLEPEGSAYNVPFAVRLSGRLDIEVLESSLRELIRRHEALRTTFSEDEQGEPVQVVAAEQDFHLQMTDLRRFLSDAREKEARSLVIEYSRLPFDLERGPLLRANLLQIGDDEHILSLVLHHTIVDGWSWSILLQEISTLYRAFRENNPSPLPELPIQYGDYATWQRDWLQGERLTKLLDYWRHQLEGAPPLLELPTDFPRPAAQTYEGELRTLILPASLLESLQELAAAEQCTLFMVLLAAFSLLLSRYSRQEDIVVGTPVAGRNRSEIEGLIGLFVNTLALRADLTGNPSFRELLQRVREVTLGAYAHQELPFEKLVEELRPERRLSHTPVFQALLLFQNVPRTVMELPELTLSSLEVTSGTAKVDLQLSALAMPNGLRLGMTYNVDLFASSTIERMLTQFQRLLESITANPAQPISALSMLSAPERQQLLAEWNDTARPYPESCVHQVFESQGERTPNAIAISLRDEQLTYRELNRRANRVAHELRRHGVGPDVLVGVCSERSIEMIVALLGILKAGGAYLPLDAAYPRERLALMAEDAGIRVVLAQKELVSHLPQEGITFITLDQFEPWDDETDWPNLVSSATVDHLAYVTYTSGSTGTPKGAAIPHRGVMRLVKNPGYADLNEQTVLLQLAVVAFDASTLEIWGALLNGGRCVLYPGDIPRAGELGKVLRQNQVNTVWLTASLFNAIVDEAPKELASLETLITGGEALSVAHVRRALEALPTTKLINGYGPTESTTFTCTYTIPRRLDPNLLSVPIGRPIGNTQVYILDQNRQPVPVGVPGELYIGGDGLARGYLNRPDLTAEKFVRDPFSPRTSARLYRSGDLCRYLPDGSIEYLRRLDGQVKVRGFRIELGEIESVLTSHPEIQQAAATVREDTPGNKQLIGYFVLKPGGNLTGTDARAYLKQKLPDYMVPGILMRLEALPLTPNGKVDRLALPVPTEQEAAGQFIAPRNSTEELLANIWTEVLHRNKISIKDNFFELGGHSLLAVRLMAEIEKATGKALPLATLFQGATIEALACALHDDSKRFDDIAIEVQGGSKPPFFAIVTPGANPLGYIALARNMDPDQPLYRIQAPGARVRKRPYTGEEWAALADRYIEAVKTVQPKGPYRLGGMCEGARIAFEMARRLERQGDEIALLAILDTWVLENSQIRLLWYIHYYRQRLRFMRTLPFSECVQIVRTSALNGLKRLFHLGKVPRSPWRAVYWPGKRFVPAKYGGKITVFKIPKQPFYYVRDPKLGWSSRTSGEVEVREISGRHNFLLREPYVQSLAKELNRTLEELCPDEPAVAVASASSPERRDPSSMPGRESRYLVRKKLFERKLAEHTGTGSAYPMSAQQRRLWVLDQLESGAARNSLLFLQLKGRLDREALEASLDIVLARHQALRARFRVENGRPIQSFAPPEGMQTHFVDLADSSVLNREEKARQLVLEELQRPFDLENGPLVRALVVHLGKYEHVLALLAHQIACDSKSTAILSREIAEIYAALLRDDELVLPELGGQYSDFAAWQRQAEQQGAFAADLEYWKRRLAGVTGTELPTDYARPPVQTFKGGVESVSIPAQTLNALRTLSQREQVPLFVVLSSVFVSLLSRYTGSEDIAFGTEVSGRVSPGTEDLIGRFANHLVLLTDASDDPSFRELLKRVSRVWTEAQQHQALPFGTLVENLHLQRDLSRNPLFQVMFSMQESAPTLLTPALKFVPLQIESGAEVMDLAVTVCEHHDNLEARFSYSTDLFLPATVQRMTEHFGKLSEAVAAAPEQRLSELVLLSDAERHTILVEWNATYVDYPRDIPLNEFIEKQVELTPDATALVFESEELTYRQLNNRANQLARRLRTLGVGPDVLVGICAERSVEQVIALHAVLKAGGAYVPLDPEYPRDRLEVMLDDAKPSVLLTQARLLERLPDTQVQIICLDRDWQSMEQESTENLPRVVGGKNLAYLIYTSGSTGKPKGVPNVHEAIVNRLLWMQDQYKLTAADRVLQKTPYSFDVSVWEFFWPFMTGACLVVARPGGHKDPVYLVNLIAEQKITTLHFVPSMLRIFLEADAVERCGSIRQVFASGEALPYELQQRFFECLKSELHNLYGPTEAAVDVTYWHCQPDSDQSIVPIGRPVANTRIYILDRNLQPVPIGVAGELHIGGVQLARGYLNRPELTAEKFIRSPFSKESGARLYKTGDLARFLPDGNIQYLGRIDHQVKLRGFRIELGEIETVLTQDLQVRQAVVIVREDLPGDKHLVAYVVPMSGQTVDAAQARSQLKSKLPEYMVPTKVVVLDQLPMTSSGKVDRKALPVPRMEPKDPASIIPARSEMESVVVETFRTVLGIDSISVTDDFFDLGGHSLMAASLLMELHRQTGSQIPLSLLFRGATPEYLARVLEQGIEFLPDAVAMLIQAGDSSPAFFAVVPPGENAVGYAKLARHMGSDQRLYKLQGPGATLVDRPYTDAEMQALARDYVAAMRSVQPEGPYHFGGMCDGAHIALRMARQLEELGEEVGMLAIFDTWVLENSQRPLLWFAHYCSQRFREFHVLPLRERIQIGVRILNNLAKKLWRRRGQRSLWSKAYWPDRDFVPPSFNGQVTLFKRPRQPYYYVRDPEMGWGSRATGGVDVQVLPIHHSEMLHEPHVRILAQRLRECLRQRFQEAPTPITGPDDEGELAISGGEATTGAS